MNIDDLLEAIRQCNYYSLDQILYAIVETNGKISVIPTSENAPATAQDVKVKNPPAKLPHIIISDGKLNKLLNSIKVSNIKEVLVLSLDEDGKMYYQIKGESYQVKENAIGED